MKEISPEEYKKKFGLENPNSDKGEALKYALEIRKFEIDLYWKRATYFWTFIAAAMAGYFLIQKSGGSADTYLSIVVGCLGFVFSFAWFCVNKGSKYWQENWENHVDLIEDFVVGPLYKIVIERPEEDKKKPIKNFVIGPAPYSVSKINQIVSSFVTLLWAVLIFHALPFDLGAPIEWQYVVIIMSLLACLVIFGWGKTDKDDHKDLVATLRETTIRKPKKERDG
ncbi:MAG: hypothetical protein GWP10_20060 [Nitrospiraceae bacterium]|nr:hypothetical protein [Nitrospiraceae bacterium]